MAQIKSGDVHGLDRIYFGLVDNYGYNYGTAGFGVSGNTLVQPYTMLYPQSGEFVLPERTTITFTGGNRWSGSYVYGINDLGTFEITLSTVEADLIALVTGSRADQTLNSRQTIYSENIMRPTPLQGWLLLSHRIQSKDPSQLSADKYFSVVCPRVWMSPKGTSGVGFQAAGTYSYTVTPTVASRMPWGPEFCATDMQLERNQTPSFNVITDYPLHTVGYVPETGDTSISITLPYKPVSFDYTTPDSSTDPVSVYYNGNQVNATSINRDTGEVVYTLGSGSFTNTDYIGVLYETDFTPTSGSAC